MKTVIPCGRWKKEVSNNKPDVMYSPEHMNNQITPEEYAMERFSETNGATLLDHDGTIRRDSIWERLKDTITGDYVDTQSEDRLQSVAAKALGGMFVSKDLDIAIQSMKQFGTVGGVPSNGGQFQQQPQGAPFLTSLQANLQKLQQGAGQTQQHHQQPVRQAHQQQDNIQMQSRNNFENALKQQKTQMDGNKIKANREQLKSLIANGGKQNTISNPYKKR